MPIGCMQILLGKGFLCFSKSDQLAVKEEDLVEISWDLAEIAIPFTIISGTLNA